MLDIFALETWEGDRLDYVKRDVIIKPLERFAEKVHYTLGSDVLKDKYYVATKITGNEKDGYELHTTIRQDEEYKYKENTHEQETDL